MGKYIPAILLTVLGLVCVLVDGPVNAAIRSQVRTQLQTAIGAEKVDIENLGWSLAGDVRLGRLEATAGQEPILLLENLEISVGVLRAIGGGMPVERVAASLLHLRPDRFQPEEKEASEEEPKEKPKEERQEKAPAAEDDPEMALRIDRIEVRDETHLGPGGEVALTDLAGTLRPGSSRLRLGTKEIQVVSSKLLSGDGRTRLDDLDLTADFGGETKTFGVRSRVAGQAEPLKIAGTLKDQALELVVDESLLDVNEAFLRDIPSIGPTLWKSLQAEGRLALGGTAQIPLDAPGNADFSLNVKPQNLTAKPEFFPARFRELNGTLSVGPDGVGIERLEGKGLEGSLLTALRIGFGEKGTSVTGKIGLVSVGIRPTASALGYEDTSLKGHVRGKVELAIRPDGNHSGRLDIGAEGIDIWHFPPMSRILELLRLSPPDAAIFERGLLTCSITREGLVIEELTLGGNFINLSAAGRVDFETRMDLAVLVEPQLKGANSLASASPAIRSQLEILRQQEMAVQLKGRLLDPKGNLVPVRHLESELRQELEKQLGGSVSRKVKEEVEEELGDELSDKLKEKIGDEVGEEAEEIVDDTIDETKKKLEEWGGGLFGGQKKKD